MSFSLQHWILGSGKNLEQIIIKTPWGIKEVLSWMLGECRLKSQKEAEEVAQGKF